MTPVKVHILIVLLTRSSMNRAFKFCAKFHLPPLFQIEWLKVGQTLFRWISVECRSTVLTLFCDLHHNKKQCRIGNYDIRKKDQRSI